MTRQQWHEDLKDWVAGWDAVRDPGAPQQEVEAWKGSVPGGDGLVLVCPVEDAVTVRGAVIAADRDVASEEVLLAGDVQELDRGLGFPGQAGVFEAPMGEYTRFEVAEWGKPVAHVALAVEGDVAFAGPVLGDQQQERDPAEVADALVSYVANEAFLADAQRLYTVVSRDEAPGRESQGWSPVAAVIRVV